MVSSVCARSQGVEDWAGFNARRTKEMKTGRMFGRGIPGQGVMVRAVDGFSMRSNALVAGMWIFIWRRSTTAAEREAVEVEPSK